MKRILSDIALEPFDKEFRDWDRYRRFLEELLTGAKVSKILDFGGGNGRFLDALLDHLPTAQGVLLDQAQSMLDRNSPHPRKRLQRGDGSALCQQADGAGYDLITVNTLLHHVVVDGFHPTRQANVDLLRTLASSLAEGGRILVYEQCYDGWFPAVEPGRLIQALTSIRAAPVAQLFRSLGANTAGVGVAFRSVAAWRRLFAEVPLAIECESSMLVDALQWKKFLLGTKSCSTHIFSLRAP